MLEVDIRKEGSAWVIAPRGRVDQSSAAAFEAALAPYLAQCREGGAAVVLDFSGVPYISSVGLRVLILGRRQVLAQKGRWAIAAPSPVVREVFQVGRFDLVFSLFDTLADALGASGSGEAVP